MKREIIQLLSEWKISKNRKPLMLRGARQVGKTYAVEMFAKEQFSNYLIVNLEERPELKSLFGENNPKKIINELSVLFNADIVPRKTLLFIDEIQNSPEAIAALRYFYEKMPELHLIAAGSLLDHTLNEMKLSMPVGRIEFCYMHPMSFKEFLMALSDDRLIEYLDKFTFKTGISEAIHKKLLDLLRYYIFIGGMPATVKAFVEKQKLNELEKTHSSILLSMQYDFAKYGNKSQLLYLTSAFKYIGLHPASRIKYVNIDKEVRSTYLKEAIRKLEMSRLVNLVKHSGSQGVPLTKYVKEDIFKALFLDIGLSNNMSGIQLTDSLSILTINEGAIAEQFTGQELLTLQPAYSEPALFYWVREEKNANAEVDFLFQHKNVIYPIEVKAGKTGKLRSMHVFLFEKELGTGIRFNTDLPSIGTFKSRVISKNKNAELTYQLLSLPLYLINQLPRLLDSIKK